MISFAFFHFFFFLWSWTWTLARIKNELKFWVKSKIEKPKKELKKKSIFYNTRVGPWSDESHRQIQMSRFSFVRVFEVNRSRSGSQWKHIGCHQEVGNVHQSYESDGPMGIWSWQILTGHALRKDTPKGLWISFLVSELSYARRFLKIFLVLF